MTIYAGTQFFNELELLEIRLETLYPIVDYFIIMEDTITHSGVSKPLYYQENKERYKKYQDKIIHYIIKDTPLVYQDLFDMTPENDVHEIVINGIKKAHWLNPIYDLSFIRDAYEKDCIIRAIPNVKIDDIIIPSDLDELPRPETLKRLLDNFDPDEIYLLANDNFYMYYNLQKISEPWFGANILTFENLLKKPVSELRQKKEGKRIENGGWHFTFMGGPKAVIKKIESYSHQEFNTPHLKDNIPYIVENCVKLGVDALGRPSEFKIRDINDGTFPEYIVKNQERLKDSIIGEA